MSVSLSGSLMDDSTGDRKAVNVENKRFNISKSSLELILFSDSGLVSIIVIFES